MRLIVRRKKNAHTHVQEKKQKNLTSDRYLLLYTYIHTHLYIKKKRTFSVFSKSPFVYLLYIQN